MELVAARLAGQLGKGVVRDVEDAIADETRFDVLKLFGDGVLPDHQSVENVALRCHQKRGHRKGPLAPLVLIDSSPVVRSELDGLQRIGVWDLQLDCGQEISHSFRHSETVRQRKREKKEQTRDGGVVLLEVGLHFAATRFDPKVGIVGLVAVDLLQL